MNIGYRRATIDDIGLLATSRIDFLEEYWGKQPIEAEDKLRSYLEQYFTKAITNGTYICFIAHKEQEFAGIGGLMVRSQAGTFKNPTGMVGYLLNMYTAPAYRRMGIGTSLLHKLLTAGKEIGIKIFELHATEEGEPLYINNGFTLHPEPTYRKYENQD